MTTPRWRKVIRDLWINKTRTLLVIISIAVGVTAIGMVLGSQGIIDRDLPRAFQAIEPASATVFAISNFDEDTVSNIEAMDEIAVAEGRRVVVVRFQTEEGEWRNLQLFAIPDFEEMGINKLTPEEGVWPPPEGGILIERSAFVDTLGFAGLEFGDELVIEPPNGRELALTIVGTTHDLNQFPPQLSQTPYGYISFETLEEMGEARAFNMLNFVVAEKQDDLDHIKSVSNLVQDRLEDAGISVIFVLSFPPGEHPLQSFLDAMSTLLLALGGLAVLLSGFLIVNTLSAILAQQVRQIGIMKAIGARTVQLTVMYFAMVLVFGILAVIISIPLGTLGATQLATLLGNFLNFDVRTFAFDPFVALIQLGIGLTIPIAAAIYPIVKGTRTTVREAISEYGVGKGQFGSNRIDLFVVGLRRLVPMERPTQISLRNTFRRKGRLILTLTTLSLATCIFISIMTIRASLQQTLDDALAYFDFDVQVQFSRPYRVERIRGVALEVEGVNAAESWGFAGARRSRPDGSESDNIIVYAPPADSEMIAPTLLEGRWLRPEDTNAIVINNDVLRTEDVAIGDTVTLKIDGRKREWVIVGLVRSSFPQPSLFINYDYFGRAVNQVGLGQVIIIRTEDGYTQPEVATSLEQMYRENGYRVEAVQTVDDLRTAISLFFNIVIIFLLFMALLLGVVGGLGLMGTMSINVIERLREIGVMRAIGASDRSVLRIVLIEGAIIGLLSWLIGGIIALPLSRLITIQVGLLLLQAPPSYIFSIWGTVAWLLIVIILAIVASFLPARSASQITVREVLSYE